MTSYVENEINVKFDFDIKEILDAVMEQVLTMENCPYEAQVNLLVTDNQGIHEFNREYRQVDTPTDVLSFPMLAFEKEAGFEVAERGEADCFDPESGELLLGDIIISADKVKEQAKKYGHSEKREFAFLTAHSMLHLCGYDHMVEEEARIMEQKQEEVLEILGITRDSK
ncbi:MAG: rRNA maturation RNase YbeY [Lachnospiraceae bacterium]|nr:rRNA maturation RNase YbeY [Lachnospiraceae bacterium]